MHQTLFMGQNVIGKLRADRVALNAVRIASGLPPHPRVSCQWVVHPFKSDSKMHQSAERRGYMLLDEVLRVQPSPVRAAWFPPARSIFIPNVRSTDH